MIDRPTNPSDENFFSLRNPQLETASMARLEMAVARWSLTRELDGRTPDRREQHTEGFYTSKERA